MKSVELFAGAGGLALGSATAGFDHQAVIEWDADACETIRENQRRGLYPVAEWPLHQADARAFDYSTVAGPVDVVIAGPPCQPFSIGGKHRSLNDERDMFPEVARSLRELRPRAVLVENVRGLLRPAFASHFEYILLQLSFPELARRDGEQWTDHLARLERYQTRGRRDGLCYQLVFGCVNAADYGVPQQRHRVFIVGFRSDLGLTWSFPEPTHSLDALLKSQWIDGEYWDKHHIPTRRRSALADSLKPRLERLRSELFPVVTKPWLTVRDAIGDLPDPTKPHRFVGLTNHKHQPGARAYAGHTGSVLDFPAKALKAGDHGVPGGENMLAFEDGSVRYFTVRESARLQHFPDGFTFKSSWTESMRQLGNAVPVTLGRVVARSLWKRLTTNAT